jgi:hypothetical protein
MVNLTTTQVETFFGELEYIEERLKGLGLAEVNDDITFMVGDQDANL